MNNQSNNTNSSKLVFDQLIIKIPLGCLLFGLSLITIFGNLLVFYAIRTEKRLRTVSNLFILSLAFADLIVGFIVMPLSTVHILVGQWPFSMALCQMWLSIDYVASTASIFNLVLLSLDRYWAVVYPLVYLQTRSRKRAIYFLLFIWFLSSLWAPAIIFWSYFYPESSDIIAPNECDTSFRSNKLFKTLTALVNFYLPLLTMILISCRIMIAIRSRSTMEFGRRISSTVQKQRRKNRLLTYASLNERERPTPCLSSIENDQQVTNLSLVINPFPTATDKQQTDGYTPIRESNFRYSNMNSYEMFFPTLKPIEQIHQRNSEILLRRYSIDRLMRNSTSVQNNMKYAERDSISSSSEECTPRIIRRQSPQQTTAPMSALSSPNNQINDYSLNDIDPSNRVHLLTFFDYIINPSLSRSLQKELKAARQLGILVGVFTVTWLPYFILFVFVAWCNRCIPEKIYTTFVWLGYLNSALNPLIYPLCNKHFRHAFRKIFFCHHGKIKLPNLDELYELHSIHALHSIRYRR